MKILVLYTSIDGHTAKIAKAVSGSLEELGHELFLTETSDPGYCDPGTFDAAILCSPIRRGGYPEEFTKFVNEWRHSLQEIPNALVTASLFIACKDPEEVEQAKSYPETLIKETGWQPDLVFNVAGSLNFPEYDFFTRWIMRRAAEAEGFPTNTKQEHDLTDWDALKAFADDFASLAKKRAA